MKNKDFYNKGNAGSGKKGKAFNLIITVLSVTLAVMILITVAKFIEGDHYDYVVSSNSLLRTVKNGYYAEPGTFSKTEDNLRLAMFYLNYGKWDGEQIVSEEWMKNALSIQIDTAENTDGVLDCRVGYGWQLWACSMPGVFRFDGGQGQYGIIWPEKNLVVALHEGGLGPDGPQITIEAIYDELMRKICDEPLPEDGDALHELREFEQSLAVPEKKPNTHTHSKPIELQTRLIAATTKDGDVVLDPASGGYSVLPACKMIGRDFIGCDIAYGDDTYIECAS